MRVTEHHWVKPGKIVYADIYYKEPAKLAALIA